MKIKKVDGIKWIVLYLLLATVLLSLTACGSSGNEGDIPDKTEKEGTIFSLDGKWKRDDRLGIEIRGTTGVIYALGSAMPRWVAAGLIEVGTTKLSNIVQKSESEWTCHELWGWYYNDENGLYWDNQATITMSSDGNTITVRSKLVHPKTGDTQSQQRTYIRETD